MKIKISSKGPNGSMSQEMSGFGSFGKMPSSVQSLDAGATLTVSIVGEKDLQFLAEGDVEVVKDGSSGDTAAVQPTAEAKAKGKGKGSIVVTKDGKPIFKVDVEIGGNVTVGLVL